MEQYCITLEQAKKLKELGFVRESEFEWYEVESADKGVLTFFNDIPSMFDHRHCIFYQAYHVGELGEFLRDWVLDIDPEFIEGAKVWFITNNEVAQQVHPTEAQARGALLIYLLENKLI